ncbi:uncharacterized protein LOC123518560 isoform X4 [Portunus trituberculatus]|uniref:uncharacterized protein LOC123518560 isoform X4 n=1 Tax=Portunus trituberculatus TaxID=210409 RepID=UPI001E1CE9C4|nr:uncharacterized protein LOC123518560 isoform X4 [Portunus trituberculatus]
MPDRHAALPVIVHTVSSFDQDTMFAPSLLLVLAMPVGAPCPAPGQNCAAADVAVKEGDASVTSQSKQTSTENISWNMYVRPDDSFQGVSLVAQGSQGKQRVWFPIPEHCFPDKSWWWEMNVGVMLQKTSTPFAAVFVVRLDGCAMSCTINTLDVGIYKLELTAHGPSSWRTKAPNASCTIVRVPSKSRITVTDCQAPPVPRLPVMCPTVSPGASSFVVEVVVVVVVVTVVGVVVAVVLAVKVRISLAERMPASEPEAPRRSTAPPAAAPSLPSDWHLEAPRGWPVAAPRRPHSPARRWQDPEDVYEEIYCNAA